MTVCDWKKKVLFVILCEKRGENTKVKAADEEKPHVTAGSGSSGAVLFKSQSVCLRSRIKALLPVSQERRS